jgi:flavin-dependent dehydrogenase
VAAFDYLFDGRGDHETIYREELDRCPAAKQRVSVGKRVAGFYATKDYSYRSSQPAGDGWVLVGDAFGFLDPLYSSGVLLALKSGQLAADTIVEGLAEGDTSAAQLSKWANDFSKGMDRMRRLVCEFYNGFSFGRFVKRYPEYKGHLTDLLIGDLFEEKVDEVVGPMDSMKEAGAYVYGSMPE